MELQTQHGSVWFRAIFVLIIGLVGVGSGFANGDAVVYAHQALSGDWFSRSIHAGYLIPSIVLAGIVGDNIPLAQDVVSAICASGCIIAIAKAIQAMGGRPTIVAAVLSVIVIPLASHAELDVVWFCVLLFAITASPLSACALTMWAVTISPLALLATPWAMSVRLLTTRGRRRDALYPILCGALLAVVGLTIWSSGDWWLGDRGVLDTTFGWRLSEVIGRWTSGTGLVSMAVGVALITRGWVAGSRGVVLTLVASMLMIIGPPDTAAYLPVAASLALLLGVSQRPMSTSTVVILGIMLILSVSEWSRRLNRVSAENAIAQRVAQTLRSGDGMVANWSWGVRVAWYREGDPYADWWRVPGSTVRDQDTWCDRYFGRIVVLPPGQYLDDSLPNRRDADGVVWTSLVDNGSQSLPICHQ